MNETTPQETHIRLFEHKDLEHITSLFAEDMKALGINTPRNRLRELMRTVLSDDGQTCRCWVADVSDSQTPVGVILVNYYHSIKFGGPSLWIEGLYVDPSFRRRSIGRQLVEFVLDWAEPRGFLGMDLEAYQGNTPAAVLYRSLGFFRLGRERFCFDYEVEG